MDLELESEGGTNTGIKEWVQCPGASKHWNLGHSHTVPPTHKAAFSHLTPGEKGGKEEWAIKSLTDFIFIQRALRKI